MRGVWDMGCGKRDMGYEPWKCMIGGTKIEIWDLEGKKKVE